MGIGPQNHQSRPSLLDPYPHFPPRRLSCPPGAPVVIPVASPSLSGGREMLQLWELGIGTINRPPPAPIPIRNPRPSAIPPAMASCHRSHRFPVAFGRSANATNVGKHPIRLPVPPAVQSIPVCSLIFRLLPSYSLLAHFLAYQCGIRHHRACSSPLYLFWWIVLLLILFGWLARGHHGFLVCFFLLSRRYIYVSSKRTSPTTFRLVDHSGSLVIIRFCPHLSPPSPFSTLERSLCNHSTCMALSHSQGINLYSPQLPGSPGIQVPQYPISWFFPPLRHCKIALEWTPYICTPSHDPTCKFRANQLSVHLESRETCNL